MSQPRIVTVSADRPDARVLREAGRIIREGGLVAFPTETVYGLGANALSTEAVARVFSAKGRPAFNPVIAHVASVAEAQSLALEWPATAARLAESFWPGPLTMVLPRRAHVPDILTAGAPAVAIRLPSHPVALGLIEAAGVPIAAPSANRSSGVSPTSAGHVARSLGDRVDLVLDAGSTRVGIESTVVDLTGPLPVILRPGPIHRGEVEAIVGPLGTRRDDAGGPLLSPGLLERHYAPTARLRLFHPDERATLAEELGALHAGEVIGGMVLGDELPGHHMLRMPDDPAGYARALYAALHQLDDLRCDVVVIELVPDEILWAGVRDRLLRAAAPGG